ncbi:MAG: hypothetical protein ACO219_03925, partial [Holophagaceae bacterium]
LALDEERFLSGKIIDYTQTPTGTLVRLEGPSLLEEDSTEYQFNKKPALFFWHHAPLETKSFLNLELGQYFFQGRLENGFLHNVKTDHPALQTIAQQDEIAFISSETLNSIGGGPFSPTLWEELVPIRNSFIYGDDELVVR